MRSVYHNIANLVPSLEVIYYIARDFGIIINGFYNFYMAFFIVS